MPFCKQTTQGFASYTMEVTGTVSGFVGEHCTCLTSLFQSCFAPLLVFIIPFQLESLHWKDGHLKNAENMYCYCGQSGM